MYTLFSKGKEKVQHLRINCPCCLPFQHYAHSTFSTDVRDTAKLPFFFFCLFVLYFCFPHLYLNIAIFQHLHFIKFVKHIRLYHLYWLLRAEAVLFFVLKPGTDVIQMNKELEYNFMALSTPNWTRVRSGIMISNSSLYLQLLSFLTQFQ